MGAPRSGTTWLQLLLDRHDEVATGPETHLFERYLSHLDEVWRREGSLEAERVIGLRPVLDETEFHRLCRAFAGEVLERLADPPHLPVVVEKTPGHVLSARFIHALFPEAWFLHVVRDPRACVSSLLRAGHGWGARWAPKGTVTGSLVWHDHVKAGLEIPSLTDRYREIRYEALHEEGVEALDAIVRALGLRPEPGWAAAAFRACSIDRLRKGEGGRAVSGGEPEPPGFFGPGKPEGWRDELTRSQLRAIEFVNADLMEHLGYARVTRSRRPPLSVRAHGILDRLSRGLDWRLRRAVAGL